MKYTGIRTQLRQRHPTIGSDASAWYITHGTTPPCVRLHAYFMSNILLIKRAPFDVSVYTYVPEARREASKLVL